MKIFSSKRVSASCADKRPRGRQSKSDPADRNLKWVGIVAIAITLTLCGAVAQAQQQAKISRIAYLSLGAPSSSSPNLNAFRRGLRQLGYFEGQNIFIEYRYAESRTERLPDLVADLVRLKVDVIAASGTQANLAAKKGAGAIPIVMTNSDDPLGSGLVESLARPGGNVTGFSSLGQELSGKRLELFREAFPKVRRVAVLWHTTANPAFRMTQTAAQALGIKILSSEVRGPEDFDNAFALVTRERSDGLFTVTAAFMTLNRKRIVEFAAKNRLPAMYHNEQFVEDGGLMSYATSIQDLHYRAATYVDKILKGAKPAELPVQQPMKFDFVVNLKAAEQIGVTIPPNLLVRAQRVIR
jgi:putative ABC transport system substrate-binding protein